IVVQYCFGWAIKGKKWCGCGVNIITSFQALAGESKQSLHTSSPATKDPTGSVRHPATPAHKARRTASIPSGYLTDPRANGPLSRPLAFVQARFCVPDPCAPVRRPGESAG